MTEPPDDAQGGAIVRGLDMTDERDRGLLRRAMADHASGHKRWGGIADDTKSSFVSALKYALKLAIDSEDHRGIRGIVATLATLEGQNQADEHKLWDAELKTIPTTQVNLNVGAADAEIVRAEVLERLRRARGVLSGSVVGPADHGNGHASGLGRDGGAGGMGNGQAPPADIGRSNGFHRGNGSAGPDR